ncbi:group II truncated hemoglobin [Saccharophagus degradans]|uniref:Group II truncated hemoglobin n=1 Tax=Saccharophagus degradans TaxID=86304 RepID=A0AAW7X2M7_9GAMM|nr:group II truncated hemoglobin [Saccharophagus degradans]MDO6421787.1 group II truncated hemoglobin [Saccharophagus degradans]MDO6606519.1 group II truncated hemoglobin [Saccharophagus degradans]
MIVQLNEYGYGQGDASYKAAGEIEGITRLVDAFYDFMDTLPEATKLRSMHAQSLEESRKKLAYFLSGWLGGPRLYAQHFGSINIPGAHRHLAATPEDADAWMLCMAKAVDLQPYEPSFKQYLLQQLRVPADRIVEAGRKPL